MLYRHKPSAVADLARLADSACEGITYLLEACVRVPQLASTVSPAVDAAGVRELQTLFAYLLSTNNKGSAQPGAALIPLDGPSAFPRASTPELEVIIMSCEEVACGA